ncbi:hypothetical protein Ancab_023605 [Ancistrocladus abbreviatus]
MEWGPRSQSLVDCESMWRCELATKEEEIADLQEKLCEALKDQEHGMNRKLDCCDIYGGDLVLLSSPDTDLLQSAVTKKAKQVAKWMVDIRPWNPREVDESTRWKNNFEMARALVLTSEAGMINDSVHLKVNDQTFAISVVEKMGGEYVWENSEMLSESQTDVGVSNSTTGVWSKSWSKVPARLDGRVSDNFG